jgi:AcrR family transcriptional regulator
VAETVKRGYRSGLRTAQAQQTRRSIVDAAATLFVRNGFGGTTVDAVAAAAGVSRKTVFTAVGGKVELLKIALDWAIAGDDKPLAVADRADVQELLSQADADALIRGWVAILVGIDRRVAGLFRALETAAGTDDAARSLYRQSRRQRLMGARLVAERVAATGGLADGLSTDEAADLLWLASDPMLFDRLVTDRGWGSARFERWLAGMTVGQVLG